jgi:hypothetical protein
MEGKAPLHRQIEDKWRARLADTYRRYSRAKRECENTAAVYSRHEIPFPDGHLGLNKALHRERLALQAYLQTLRVVTDITLHGKLPPIDSIPSRDR